MGVFRYTRRTFGRELVLIAAGIVFAMPFYILIVLSLKSNQTIQSDAALAAYSTRTGATTATCGEGRRR